MVLSISGFVVFFLLFSSLIGVMALGFLKWLDVQPVPAIVEHEMTRLEFDQLIASKEAHARAPLQEQIAGLERTVATQQAELTRLRQDPNSTT